LPLVRNFFFLYFIYFIKNIFPNVAISFFFFVCWKTTELWSVAWGNSTVCASFSAAFSLL
jgi:hypothetical protein